jgi:catechol 2,3-dioxygenase-like lactoylglutathione lyase family enzyme
MKVVHLMMPANKFAEAVKFYVEGLGLKSDTAEAGSIMFVVGRQKIKLVPVPGPLLQRHTNLSLHVHDCTNVSDIWCQQAASHDRISPAAPTPTADSTFPILAAISFRS